MARIYKLFRGTGRARRLASPFWYIEHRDPARVKIGTTGRVVPVREVTPFRIANALETAKARELEARMSLVERSAHGQRDQAAWQLWVQPFIAEKYANPRSRERYLTAWRMLEWWLRDGDMRFPAQVSYAFCETYIPWRSRPDPEERKFKVRRSTMNFEFKFFRKLMKRAVQLGFCMGNPAREMELSADKSEPRILKPDLDDAVLRDIWSAFDAEPEPRRTCFRRAFAISLLHGARENELNVNPQTDLMQVKLQIHPRKARTEKIWIIKFFQKGGRERWKPLHPQLLPLFTGLRAEGATQTFPLGRKPDGRLEWNTAWHNFFTHKPADGVKFKQRPGLEHICFHSLRVTVQNVLREAGVAKEVREIYLTHEHETEDNVNALYDRVKLREMLACHGHLARKWLVVG